MQSGVDFSIFVLDAQVWCSTRLSWQGEGASGLQCLSMSTAVTYMLCDNCAHTYSYVPILMTS